MARQRYRLGAPSSLASVNRKDVGQIFRWIRAQDGAQDRTWRPHYAWGLAQAGLIAAGLGVAEFSAIELGVAGGTGLVAMETSARRVEDLLGIKIKVFGFDTGTGMPPPTDHRDAPGVVEAGQFPMDEAALRARLVDADLRLGLVGDTLPAWVEEKQPPLGFMSLDLDYYSSAVQAFKVFEADDARLMPRVPAYFQATLWHPWNDVNGPRAAVKDFNDAHEMRKIGQILGLKYALPRTEFFEPWHERMFVAEIFDHRDYATPQGVPALDQSLV